MAFTISDVAAIERAIKSGTLSVQYGDRRVTYQSMDALLKARDLILAEVEVAEGTPRPRAIRMFQSGTGR